MARSRENKLATIAVDLDSVSSHLRGYGVFDCADTHSNFEVAIPRILEISSRLNAKITFFIIAEEAKKYGPLLRSLVASGHEIASHSSTHPLPLRPSDLTVAEREIRGSKTTLEELTNYPVQGFRAPSWQASPALFQALARAGYFYDASVVPSLALYIARAVVALNHKKAADRVENPPLSYAFSPLNPYLVTTPEGIIREAPVMVLPVVRIPIYHTIRLILPGTVGRFLLRAACKLRSSLSYTFHAVDFLSFEEDHLDERIRVHPGMKLALEEKLSLAEEVMKEVLSGNASVTCFELAKSLPLR